MPVFEYKCAECGKKFEELVSRADEPVACPTCNSTDTEKLMSAFASPGSGPSGGSCTKSSCAGCSGCH